jgi:DNA-binding SARP family transcriptional activator
MRYEILGPLRVVDDADESSYISAPKIETLLAVLLARANQVVAHDHLIAEIWGDQRPRRATAGLHVYVSQLRKLLCRPRMPDTPILTRPPGYLLRLGQDEADFHVFLRLVDKGRACALEHRYEQARDCCEDALRLWRGPVFADVCHGPILEGFVTWLMEARLECIETLAGAQLELGQHRHVVGELYKFVAENPFREAFYRQLMLALYRSDRKADALQIYQMARRVLNEELGLEPCRALQQLHAAILAADEQLDRCAA